MTQKKGKILIVDDNVQILNSLKLLLKEEFEHVITIKNPNLIPEKIKTDDIDIILLDMNFAAGRTTGNEGIFWMREILKIDPFSVIILIAAYGDIELAVKAIKEGATDFIQKPWNAEKLIATLNAAFELRKSKIEVNSLKIKQKQINKDIDKTTKMFMGTSKVMQQVFATVYKVALTEANVLILGENGTGKELIAREIHRRSPRSEEVFVNVDLGSITETLFESEMFGHVKGAFTDAKEGRIGRFEAASDGTLFLDEIGNLSIGLQAKLLAALQNRKISKVGSSKSIPINIRLICATNKNLLDMVNNGLFRDDLLYRINTIQIEVPPLRHRKDDIPGLSDYFLKHFVTKYEKYNLKISSDGYKALLEYNWPGNIRELKHTIEKAVILADSAILHPADFYLAQSNTLQSISQSSMKLADIEAKTITEALKACGGNVTKAAKMLDISRTTLYTKIGKYNLPEG